MKRKQVNNATARVQTKKPAAVPNGKFLYLLTLI